MGEQTKKKKDLDDMMNKSMNRKKTNEQTEREPTKNNRK